jgi:hypothetical protein
MSKRATTIEAEVLPPETSLQTPGTGPAEPLHNHYHRCAQTAAAQATGYAILCGLELQRVRAEVAKPGKRSDLPTALSGGWEKWVEENCEFSTKTAQRYIAVADGIKGRLAQTTASKHLASIVDIAPSALDSGQREKLLKSVSKVTEGQTLQQLYMDFGITKADPRTNLRKGGATHHNGRPPARNLDAEVAHAEAVEILTRLAKFVQTGQHQLLEKPDIVHLDQQLLAARETFKPYVKA